MAFRFEVLTLFPNLVTSYAAESVVGRACAKGLLEVTSRDIREYAAGKHRVTDDVPYGGGAGMVMKVEPMALAIEAARARLPAAKAYLMSPRGAPLTQALARQLSLSRELILVCGRYEGVDERVGAYVDAELSVGDFVLSGGELAALCVLDAVARLVPQVLGNAESAGAESFEQGLLEYPHYTRPPEFRGAQVPAVLQSGDHGRIARWRRWQSLQLTCSRRSDLWARLTLTPADEKLLAVAESDL